ncbi:MAG: crossover junction endodeoxyribonuclease RuvC [Terriglobia bacterium]
MRVLGVDCGSFGTGVGVVESDGRGYRVLHYGAIRPARSAAFADRLNHIHQELERLVKRFRPDTIALEQVFQAFNVKSAMQLSQVRGVVLLAAARAHLPVSEYSALAVKSGVVGYGRAEKHQVQRMVQHLLALPAPPEPDDAADALAVALCHIHTETARRRLAGNA